MVFGAGAMTLSLYTLHVVLRTDGVWDGEGWVHFLGQVALVGGIGAFFAARRFRGPLELLVGEISSGVRRAVAGRG